MFDKKLFKGKKVIIFDLDGTIVDLVVDWVHLKSILSDKYSKLYGENCKFKSISACLSKIVEKNDNRELINFFTLIRQYELKDIKSSNIIKETVFFINNRETFGVEKGTKLAICSLNTREAIIESLKLANIHEKIDYIVGREDVRKWKPHPEGLLKIKDHFKLKNEELIYFGDLDKDILTGKNAAINSYLISDLIDFLEKS